MKTKLISINDHVAKDAWDKTFLKVNSPLTRYFNKLIDTCSSYYSYRNSVTYPVDSVTTGLHIAVSDWVWLETNELHEYEL
jgi:hypothetical protein